MLGSAKTVSTSAHPLVKVYLGVVRPTLMTQAAPEFGAGLEQEVRDRQSDSREADTRKNLVEYIMSILLLMIEIF